MTLTQKEQARSIRLLNGLLAEHIPLDQAATLIGCHHSLDATKAHSGSLPRGGSLPPWLTATDEPRKLTSDATPDACGGRCENSFALAPSTQLASCHT